MSGLKWGNEYRISRVCVDTYHEGAFSGRFYHPSRPEGEIFHSLSQYLIKMEALLDEMDCPQSHTEARSFIPASPPESIPPKASGAKQGKQATFEVRVLFRQHASWQGEVLWAETGMSQRFRSVLELILLMDSALREGAA